MTKMQFLNFCTKYSVKRWNKNPFLRRCFRKIAHHLILRQLQCDSTLQHLIHTTKLQGGVNLYPWPYCKMEGRPAQYVFAPWSEEDEDCIVGDCFGDYVIRHSTSYCAVMIYYATGKILTKKRQHAKYWVETLAANGFDQIVKRPIDGGYYIGVAPHIGTYGQLYWFEYTDTHYRDGLRYFCSTYKDFQYEQCWLRIDRKDIKWVKIA